MAENDTARHPPGALSRAGESPTAEAFAGDKYDARLDDELAKMDAPSPARVEQRRGGPFFKSYLGSTLPFSIVLGAYRALQGGSFAEVLGGVALGTLIGGVVTFVLRSLRRNDGDADEARATGDADSEARQSSATNPLDDARYDAQLDEELDSRE